MKIKELNKKSKAATIIIDNSLDQYKSIPLFQDKVDKANLMLGNVGLPDTGKNNVAANPQSAQKRIRQNSKRRLGNRYFGKASRNLIHDFRAADKKAEAGKALPKVVALLDKLAKRGNIHKNKASNLKSKLMRRISDLKK